MNQYYDNESAHSNLMYWWHGVIVDDKFWAGCSEGDVSNEHSALHPRSSGSKGWNKRYKVAVVGRHYASKAPCGPENDVLEMAEVLYPPTAGSGRGGTRQIAALRHGDHVVGFYADGAEGRNPVIIGTFGVNQDNEPTLIQADPPSFFDPRSGNKGCCGDKLKPVKEPWKNLGSDIAVESNDSPLQLTEAHKTKRKDGDVTEPILSTMKCEGPSGIIQNIKLLLKKLSFYINESKKGVGDLISGIDGVIKSVTRAISSLTNTLLDRAKGYLINLINNGIKGVINFLPPFLRPGFGLNAKGAIGGLVCAFNKIKDNVFGVVKDLTQQFISNYVNAPLCAATSFLGSLLGNVIGQVNSAVDTAVGAINSILDIGSGFADKFLDVLDFVLDVLNLFDCEEENQARCPDTTQWSFWNGPKDFVSKIPEVVSSTVSSIISDVETALPGSAEGSRSNPCNSRQVPCGPPKVQIIGGGGSGAEANVVVGVTGKILGLDFSAFGSGYTYEPQINIIDSCGTGGGAVVQPVMRPTGELNQYSEEILELVDAVVIDSGSQYLPAPNGTTGGNGYIFSQPSDTIHFQTGSTQIINGKEVNGTGFNVYACGTTFNVLVGDEVYLPSGLLAFVYDSDGNEVQKLNGLGHNTLITVTASGTLTAPCYPEGDSPSYPQAIYPLSVESINENAPESSYPIVATIDSVVIKDAGYGYKPSDSIRISSNSGAELNFITNDKGQVTTVNVLNGGLGFGDMPTISIQSETGFNFEAVPVFKFTPLSDVDLNNQTIPVSSKIISVIDCVGKVV